mgnify:CR=1 FL=1
MAIPSRLKSGWGKRLLWVLAASPIVLAAIQFVPYGRDYSPKPSPDPFQWHDPQAESIARVACYDCHSNETKWWWAVKVAPFSWLAQSDIDEGRRKVNFSDWGKKPLSAKKLEHALNDGMPPIQYTIAHPEARITEAQKQALVKGFQASLEANAAKAPAAAPAPLQTPEAIIQARCTGCHAPSRALKFRASSPEKAQALIDKMIRKGSDILPPETQSLVAYFTR